MDRPKLASPVLKFRLNCIDHYQAAASSLDPVLQPLASSNTVEARDATVPIVRVFGSTETGQKVCAHIHGAFPYLYIAYDGSLDSSTGRLSPVVINDADIRS
jgi:DNA polymerase zeta